MSIPLSQQVGKWGDAVFPLRMALTDAQVEVTLLDSLLLISDSKDCCSHKRTWNAVLLFLWFCPSVPYTDGIMKALAFPMRWKVCFLLCP